MSNGVWVLDFEVTDEDGDFATGHQSVHATEKSAAWKLFDLVAAQGFDPRSDAIQVIQSTIRGHAEATGTSVTAADLELPDGRQVHYAITPYDVEELA